MMLGFFLPGDTLLLSAGLLASQGKLPLGTLIATIAVAAVLGDNTGYTIGKTMGPRLFHKKDGVLFRHEYVVRAETFFEKHGSKTMLLAHYIPIIRSFAPLVAGVAKMRRLQFFVFDAVGDISWAAITTLIGFWFGSKIPNLDHYILPVFIAVVVISFVPTMWHIFGDAETRQRLAAMLRRRKG